MRMKQVWARWFVREEDKKKALRERLDFAMTQNANIRYEKEKTLSLSRSDFSDRSA